MKFTKYARMVALLIAGIGFVTSVGYGQTFTNNPPLASYYIDLSHYNNFQTPVLSSNTNYCFRAYGRGGVGPLDRGEAMADAAFYPSFHPLNADTAAPNNTWEWVGHTPFRPTPDVFQSNHIYYFYFQGGNTSETLIFQDNPYGDNVGGFNVDLFEVSQVNFLTNGLVAYYPFNGNADDASGNGRNATPGGNFLFTNNVLHLTGDNALFYSGGGHVILPDYGNLNSGFTMSIWVANETDHGSSIMAEYYVWFDNDPVSSVHIYQHDCGFGDPSAYVNFPLAIADYTPWKQLVLVYSPTRSAAYLNGIEIGSTNNVTVNPFPVVRAAIGRHWWAGGANSSARMTMDVKNFRIYNRALSSNEVQQLHLIEAPEILNVKKAVYLDSPNLKVGTNYQIQVSGDLNTWTNHGAPFTATNSNWRSTNYWDVDNWGKLFFRLH